MDEDLVLCISNKFLGVKNMVRHNGANVGMLAESIAVFDDNGVKKKQK